MSSHLMSFHCSFASRPLPYVVNVRPVVHEQTVAGMWLQLVFTYAGLASLLGFKGNQTVKQS